MLDKIIDIIMTVLPFFGGRKKRQQMMQEVKEFSELVKEQYNFLMQQLEKVLKDYFNLSDRVKEMHSEIFSLKGKLVRPAAKAKDLNQAAARAIQATALNSPRINWLGC